VVGSTFPGPQFRRRSGAWRASTAKSTSAVDGACASAGRSHTALCRKCPRTGTPSSGPPPELWSREGRAQPLRAPPPAGLASIRGQASRGRRDDGNLTVLAEKHPVEERADRHLPARSRAAAVRPLQLLRAAVGHEPSNMARVKPSCSLIGAFQTRARGHDQSRRGKSVSRRADLYVRGVQAMSAGRSRAATSFCPFLYRYCSLG